VDKVLSPGSFGRLGMTPPMLAITGCAASDEEVWDRAKRENCILVSADSDSSGNGVVSRLSTRASARAGCRSPRRALGVKRGKDAGSSVH
jgi:hypothetical protein